MGSSTVYMLSDSLTGILLGTQVYLWLTEQRRYNDAEVVQVLAERLARCGGACKHSGAPLLQRFPLT